MFLNALKNMFKRVNKEPSIFAAYSHPHMTDADSRPQDYLAERRRKLRYERILTMAYLAEPKKNTEKRNAA